MTSLALGSYDFLNAFILASLPRENEPFVTCRRPPVEVTYQSPEPSALPLTLEQLSAKYKPLIDRVLMRLSESERKEVNLHLKQDYRQAWITVSYAQRMSDAFVQASYIIYGKHPDKIWPSIVADNKARLGSEYYDWYDSADIRRPDVPRLPPRKAESPADGAGLSDTAVRPVPKQEVS